MPMLPRNSTLRFKSFAPTMRRNCVMALPKLFILNIASFTKCLVATPLNKNGVVERKHRHLLEMARALYFQSNLPISFWGECVQTAAYLINRSPLSVLGHISPYEKLHGTPPSFSHLKAFGCLCFVSSLKHNRSKFAPRADITIFNGYSLSQKSYKTFNPKTNSIVFSRDVVFHEHHFPYHSTTPSSHFSFLYFLPSYTYSNIPL